MKVSAVVTTHNNEMGLANILEQLNRQTRKPDEILVFASNTDIGDFTATYLKLVEDMLDWGHEKRAMGLEKATGDLVGFFNDDDAYTDDYIEKMVAGIGDKDIVFCDFKSHLMEYSVIETSAQLGRCTSGNFLVRTGLAKTVGYAHREYEADWYFIEDLLKAGATWVRVPEVLYHHN